MAKKKISKTKQHYRRVRSNLLRKIARASKRGYLFNENLVPDIPKKVTKSSIKRLEKISSNLYKLAEHVDFETGEVISGTEARQQERKESARKGALTRNGIRYNKEEQNVEEFEYNQYDYSLFPSEAEMVISNFKANVISRFPENAGPVLHRWLNNIIAQNGKEAVAKMLQDAQENGIIIDYKVAYDNDLLMGAIGDMIDYLPEIGNIAKQEIFDSLEMEEDWELPS